MKVLLKYFFILSLHAIIFPQTHKVIESNANYIIIECDFSDYKIADSLIGNKQFQIIKTGQLPLKEPGEPALPEYSFNLGKKPGLKLTFTILEDVKQTISNKFILPAGDSSSNQELFFKQSVYDQNNFFPANVVQPGEEFTFRYSQIIPVIINPFQFNPISRELIYHRKIKLRINYISSEKTNEFYTPVNDRVTDEFLKSSVANYSVAKAWMTKSSNALLIKEEKYWYNPQKTYYKIYLNKEGVYRISYDELKKARPNLSETISSKKLELYCMGKELPIHIMDNDDGQFNSGDYFQFVGSPPQESPNAKTNIYNNENVYWLSFQADSSGLRYKEKDGYPNRYEKTFHSSLHTIHFEKDSIYERLGLADDDKRDYWFWGRAYGDNGTAEHTFNTSFILPNISEDYMDYTLRINLHGITDYASITPDHSADVMISSQLVSTFNWDGQNIGEFSVPLDRSKILLFDNNNLQIHVKGSTTPNFTRDEIRINWFEVDYWREFRVLSNSFQFKSTPGELGLTRFYLYQWFADTMLVYVPQHNELIKNPWITNSIDKEVFFVDSVYERTEYFCVSDNAFLAADSIIVNVNSDIRNSSNGADYIIITHPKFIKAAEKLAQFRSENLSGFEQKRIKIISIEDIYKEFSFGLLDPFAVKKFLQYTFTSWQAPSPAYVVLLGDMSWDYRHLSSESRLNYIPSIPYHSVRYGQAVSDNMFAAVSGNDVIPDMAIGRISCETVEEADVLIDKIINYPADPAKQWKEKVLLIGAGENLNDENYFGFNKECLRLENSFLLPNGFPSVKIFRYPDSGLKQFYGERPEIRKAFNDGCAFASFYGHGGGAQWDFVFLKDDIYLLQNENRLPFISSVTCYTVHFDNQDVFGEVFNKIPGKGSIAFWGHTGITFWNFGLDMNKKMFNEIFNNNHYVIGDAILLAKSSFGTNTPLEKDHVALLTLLGDPALKLALPDKPDISVSSSSFEISPEYPVVDDTISIKVKINNYGRNSSDSLTVELFRERQTPENLIGKKRIKFFGQQDSVSFLWIPKEPGSENLIVNVNNLKEGGEIDFSDNSAGYSFNVYKLSEPNIIKPQNGLSTSEKKIKFIISDIGYYISRSFSYFIEIDTLLLFSDPLKRSAALLPADGILEWNSPELKEGIYYWRIRMLEDQQYSNWTKPRTFSINSNPVGGYAISKEQLKSFELSNMIYSKSLKGLILNSSLLPPKPSNQNFIEDIPVTLPEGLNGLTAMTTDGSFIYFSDIAYYGGESIVYKMGTGNNGTIKGNVYGPVSTNKFRIIHQMFYHSDGYIYIADGSPYSLIRMNPQNGDTSRITIVDGIINSDGRIKAGGMYLASDGKYVYNVANKDSMGNDVYTIRVFDPSSDWKKIKYINPTGSSYYGFSGFFVAANKFYPYENYNSGWMRRIDLSSGEFEEEWLSFIPFQGFYAWSYDWTNDVIYASVYRSGKEPKITKFAGMYKQGFGSFTSDEIGPAAEWKNINFDITDKGAAKFENVIEGLNKISNTWDTLSVNIQSGSKLNFINSNSYPFIRMKFDIIDSSFGTTNPLVVKSINVDYSGLPEISLSSKDLNFNKDSLIQGFPVQVNLRIKNFGFSEAHNYTINFYLDDSDSSFHTEIISIPADSMRSISFTVTTSELISSHKIKVVLKSAGELYTYNNLIEQTFYIQKDEINPTFNITFDGTVIFNNDVVSAHPKIVMTLEDNSPLPLTDTSNYYIYLDAEPVSFRNDSLKIDYSKSPNSKAVITWYPKFKDGRHLLEVLAKDASGNFFDTTSYSVYFRVKNENDLLEVYNYPNPFQDNTYFTFNLTGVDLPEVCRIKIFTIAGRLIREIEYPVTDLHFGFNRIYFDGRDEDGNELANGVYFYKIMVRNKNVFISKTQKLAKVK